MKTEIDILNEVLDETSESFQMAGGIDFYDGKCSTVLNAMLVFAQQESKAYRKFCQLNYKTIALKLLAEPTKDFDTVAYELYLQSKTK